MQEHNLSDEELEEVYNLFMERFFEEEDED